ncbi:MAG: RNA polymerase sigma factor [Chitinophagaceae bacterium]
MDQKPSLTDEELLSNYYTSKDNRWLGQLLERYSLLLYGVAMKYLKEENDARDIVQQVFVKVVEELEKYPVTHFKAWIFTIVKNQCLMKLRQTAQKPIAFSENLSENLLVEVDLSLTKHQEKSLALLEEALTTLNKAQRECITLFYLEKLSYQQITERTSYSQQEVKSYIQNGKRNLKIWLLQKEGNHE